MHSRNISLVDSNEGVFKAGVKRGIYPINMYSQFKNTKYGKDPYFEGL